MNERGLNQILADAAPGSETERIVKRELARTQRAVEEREAITAPVPVTLTRLTDPRDIDRRVATIEPVKADAPLAKKSVTAAEEQAVADKSRAAVEKGEAQAFGLTLVQTLALAAKRNERDLGIPADVSDASLAVIEGLGLV